MVDGWYPVPTKEWKRRALAPQTFREIGALREELRAERFDLCVDMQWAIRSAVVGRMAGTRVFAGAAEPREESIMLVIDDIDMDFLAMGFERTQIENFLRSNGGHLPAPVSISIMTEGGLQPIVDGSADGNQVADASPGEAVRRGVGERERDRRPSSKPARCCPPTRHPAKTRGRW